MRKLLVSVLLLGCLPLTAQGQERRGDVAFGYQFMHETGFDMPLGFNLSDSWRKGKNIDLVLETQLSHGNSLGVGFNIWGLMGGIRGTGSSRYGDKVGAFGQVLAGVIDVSASVAGSSGSTAGFGLQPGFGVEVPLTRNFAIRPEFDVLIGRINGSWTRDLRFSGNAVFVLFKNK